MLFTDIDAPPIVLRPPPELVILITMVNIMSTHRPCLSVFCLRVTRCVSIKRQLHTRSQLRKHLFHASTPRCRGKASINQLDSQQRQTTQLTQRIMAKIHAQIVDINSTSSAVWWIKNPSARGRRKQWKQGRCDVSVYQDVSLFRNISVHGYSTVLMQQLSVWEKFLWLVVLTTIVLGSLVVLSLLWENYVAQNFTISLHDQLYPVENVPFPAVSICSNNRISRQAAEEYANALKLKDPVDHPLSYYLHRIESFSSMYFKFGNTLAMNISERFQVFLDNYGTWDNETFFDTRRMMKLLTPSCEDFLITCHLAGSEIDCMSRTAFQNSMTIFGPCCTFNMENSYGKRLYRQRFVDPLGLRVTLNNSQQDNFSLILNGLGSLVIVHTPGQFPDVASGGCQLVYPSAGSESFISVNARIIDTDEPLKSFSPKSRKCFFDNEVSHPDILMWMHYSYTNCITRCRIKSILILCKCLPFFMPRHFVESTDEEIIFCTLQHIMCLKRYDFKWRNVITQNEVIPGLEREMEEGLYCTECLPSCNDVQYEVSLTSLPSAKFHSCEFLDLNHTENLLDVSVVHIHFAEPYVQHFRRVCVNAWFESISAVGNILSIFIGFSLVSVFEILFCACKYLIRTIRYFLAQQAEKRNQKNTTDALSDSKLYICP